MRKLISIKDCGGKTIDLQLLTLDAWDVITEERRKQYEQLKAEFEVKQ